MYICKSKMATNDFFDIIALKNIRHKFHFLIMYWGYRGSTVVKVLCYKPEGRWFDPS